MGAEGLFDGTPVPLVLDAGGVPVQATGERIATESHPESRAAGPAQRLPQGPQLALGVHDQVIEGPAGYQQGGTPFVIRASNRFDGLHHADLLAQARFRRTCFGWGFRRWA